MFQFLRYVQEKKEFNFFGFVRDVTLIISVFLYFAGWVYVATVWDKFGISFRTLGIDYFSVLIYSVNVIKGDYWYCILISLAIVIALLLFLKKQYADFYPPAALLSTLLLFAGMYYVSSEQGKTTARKYQQMPGNKFKRVQLFLNDSAQLADSEIMQLSNEDRLYFVNETEEMIFLYGYFTLNPTVNGSPIVRKNLFSVKKSLLSSYKLYL